LDGATVVSTGVNYNATAADQGRLIKATVAGIIITTPDATVVNAPFSFAVNNQSTGTITLDGSGSQTIDGSATQVIGAGSGCILKTDGTNWFTYGLRAPQITTSGANWGFTEPINLQLTASVASNILTVSVKTGAGNDPSSGDPVLIPFRSTTLASGAPVWRTLTAALNISTNAVGATLGTQNSVPFRFWIDFFDNAGTVVMALWHSGAGATVPTLKASNESTLQSTTGISAAATSSGVFYTPNGVSLANKAFRHAGFLEYSAGLATAGTYNIAPTTVQLFGPGVKKPGDVVQNIPLTTTTTTVINAGTPIATALAQAVTTTSNANPFRITASGFISIGNQVSPTFQIFRNTGAVGVGSVSAITGNGSTVAGGAVFCQAFDAPTSANWPPTQYGLYGENGTTNSGNSNTFLGAIVGGGGFTGQGFMTIEEIMA
jgi:hypothetical protein